MIGYRLCFMNTEDRAARPIELDCANDAAAMARASELARGRLAEIWHFDRVVGRLDQVNPPGAPNDLPARA